MNSNYAKLLDYFYKAKLYTNNVNAGLIGPFKPMPQPQGEKQNYLNCWIKKYYRVNGSI